MALAVINQKIKPLLIGFMNTLTHINIHTPPH